MKRQEFLAATVGIIAQPAAARADDRMRVLWLRRDGDEVRVPYTRDSSFVYLSGFDAICWLLRDKSVPAEKGYAALSIDLLQTLYEIQSAIGDGPLEIVRGFCVASPVNEPDALAQQHLAGLAVDVVLGPTDRQTCGSRGLLRSDELLGPYVHVTALKDRWKDARV